MMARSLGIIGATSTLVVSFARTSNASQGLKQIASLAAGLVVLAIFGTSSWVDARLSWIIRWALRRWSDLEVRDYSELLGIRRGYGVLEILVHPESWLADRTLSELELPDEGVTVLGIHRNDGSYVAAPHGRSRVQANDQLILYGRSEHLSTLGDRPSGRYGDQEREAAQKEQVRIVTEQDGQERSRTMRS
ncbi:MAG TPA: TrkA C-terminal domain-containing protein [Nitrolancea sp.]|jgi:hypothetical protein|nr:TrkA C-terminal domain-containing protein [Nitrolancea sp.]